MGNCIEGLLVWLFQRSTAAAEPQQPNKVSINCACFNSQVVDDTDSSSSSGAGGTNEEKEKDDDDIYFSIE